MLRMRWRFNTPSVSAAKKVAPYLPSNHRKHSPSSKFMTHTLGHVRLIKLINVAKSIKPDYGGMENKVQEMI